MKILLVDHRDQRRRSLRDDLSTSGKHSVQGYSVISKDEFEHAIFDVAVIHYGNLESHQILNGYWSELDRPIIYFSGGFSSDINRDGKDLFISEARLSKEIYSIEKLMSYGL